MIAMFVISILTTTLITFLHSYKPVSFLTRDSLAFSDLATQSQRVGNVVRGLTDISLADNNELTMYAYFAPDERTFRIVHYY